MKNYIYVNGQEIELTEEQVRQIAEVYGKSRVQLAEIPTGEVCKIGEYEFIVLEHHDGTTAVLLKDPFPEEMEFGNNNNYNGSKVDAACNAFAEKIADIVGIDNMVTHTVDLTSNDGLKDYGAVSRSASLITADMYRKFVEILDKFNPKRWWWLATPHSTKRHENDSWVKCVAPSGRISHGNYSNVFGVRPFCILKSTIFVSK